MLFFANYKKINIMIKKYDIIFMDCQIPVINGFEATLKIRENEKIKNDLCKYSHNHFLATSQMTINNH